MSDFLMFMIHVYVVCNLLMAVVWIYDRLFGDTKDVRVAQSITQEYRDALRETTKDYHEQMDYIADLKKAHSGVLEDGEKRYVDTIQFYKTEISDLKESYDKEISDLRDYYSREISELTQKLTACKNTRPKSKFVKTVSKK